MQELAANLGIGTLTVPIESAHTVLGNELVSSIAGSLTRVADENLQARIRGVMLMSLANTFDWLVLTTGNKSEAAVGYSTLYGDTVGAYAPIKDVYKTVVYELVGWRNERDGAPMVPISIIEKAPSAELRPNQRDDDSLPNYEDLDPLLEYQARSSPPDEHPGEPGRRRPNGVAVLSINRTAAHCDVIGVDTLG